jgi:hypothetical protein
MGLKNLMLTKKIIYDSFAIIYVNLKVFRIDQKLLNIFKFIDYRLVKWQTM